MRNLKGMKVKHDDQLPTELAGRWLLQVQVIISLWGTLVTHNSLKISFAPLLGRSQYEANRGTCLSHFSDFFKRKRDSNVVFNM